jgi:hypothetical protein
MFNIFAVVDPSFSCTKARTKLCSRIRHKGISLSDLRWKRTVCLSAQVHIPHYLLLSFTHYILFLFFLMQNRFHLLSFFGVIFVIQLKRALVRFLVSQIVKCFCLSAQVNIPPESIETVKEAQACCLPCLVLSTPRENLHGIKVRNID